MVILHSLGKQIWLSVRIFYFDRNYVKLAGVGMFSFCSAPIDILIVEP